ncbi:hypothetical protein [Rossellomorea marisflavi]|uniref:hypothetical protein n=1 Tax=Rossellomorea marisflavi TaxID=189381 RepID=UPI0015C455B4|nr:hypothetical protein [Rossellomorea marisflavi]
MTDIIWQSDWCGDEVGYDDVSVVGLYYIVNPGIYYYINAESGEVLEAWPEEID